ncbi:MAG TPA: hypothetical protein VJS65_08450 [Verrucomicrobiae bacterium]|nr:hypothetical protein [Verrucomicrobiae bacterium]
MPLPWGGSTRVARFTRDGSDALEQTLERICQDVLVRIQQIVPSHRLEAILLGGGYGRGEGGVLKTTVGDRPYNDLEYYVCVRGSRFFSCRRSQSQLHHLAAEMTTRAGIDVEFQVVSRDSLCRSPVSMFYYDLIAGHRWIWGDTTLLDACGHLRSARAIPALEATRLLMNRCTGLLLARQKLQRARLDTDDADFIGRNIAKAQLALGDAVLTAFGQYDWSCLERATRLKRLLACRNFPWSHAVGHHHAAGLEFKLHPRRTMAGLRALAERHAEVTVLAREVWLWLENRRLGQDFRSPGDYAFSSVNKCPNTPAWRNCLLNLHAFRSPVFLGDTAHHHPRERLFHALAVLLWGGKGNGERAPANDEVRFLQMCLCTAARDRDGLVAAYVKLWRRFQ